MPSFDQVGDVDVQLLQETAYSKRKLRVVTIGAGFSGLIFAHKIQHQYPELQTFIDHTIFEARDGVGGTWKVNTYPGVQCDVPAHIYAFPFDPNPNWSKFYADGDEIQEYIEGICDKWDLRKDIQFSSKVVDATWQEKEGKWKIVVQKGDKEEVVLADVLISAQGFLSRWRWPNIPGLHDFKGHKVHSAEWDHKFDYSNKRIGIVGNGSSGIQILPQMAKLPGTDVTSFQKGPTWIIPSLGATIAGIGKEDPDPPKAEENKQEVTDDKTGEAVVEGSDFNPRYTAADKQNFAEASKHKEYRKMLQAGMNKGFQLYKKDGERNRTMTEATIASMREKLNNDPDLCSKLIPSWTLGCRRLTPGEGYLESFLQSNVHLAQSPIVRITETGIQTRDDPHLDIDVLVCATGFDASNIPHFPVTGRDGMTLAEKWKDEPESYLSLACPDFPNYFIFTGPNATVGHGTLTTSMSWSADYMIKWLRKISSEHIKSVSPKQSATDEFVRYGKFPCGIRNTPIFRPFCTSNSY